MTPGRKGLAIGLSTCLAWGVAACRVSSDEPEDRKDEAKAPGGVRDPNDRFVNFFFPIGLNAPYGSCTPVYLDRVGPSPRRSLKTEQDIPLTFDVKKKAASTAGTELYADEACTKPGRTAVLKADATSVAIYFKGTPSPGEDASIANDREITARVEPDTVLTSGASVFFNPPTKPTTLLRIDALRSLLRDACARLELDTVSERKIGGDPVTADLSISLSARGAKTTIHSDASCSKETSKITIPKGSEVASFFVRAKEAGEVEIVASAPGHEMITDVKFEVYEE